MSCGLPYAPVISTHLAVIISSLAYWRLLYSLSSYKASYLLLDSNLLFDSRVGSKEDSLKVLTSFSQHFRGTLGKNIIKRTQTLLNLISLYGVAVPH